MSQKYLLVTLEYPPFYGGIAHYYSYLVKNFPEPITVLDNSQQQLMDNQSWPVKWRPALLTIWRAIKQGQINYVLVGHLWPLGFVTWLIAKLLPIKYCLFLHGDDFNYTMCQPRKVKLALKVIHQAHKIICANSYTAEKVKKVIDQKQLGKIKVVNPGVGQRPAYDELAVKRIQENYNLVGQTVLFSVCRLVERKGLDLVIDCLPELIKLVPNLVYYIAGTGPDENYLQDKVASLPVTVRKRVHFLGKISEETKWQWLDICQIFVMPARNIGNDIEGFGIVYLEANLAGKPVIAGRSGGVTDAVEDNVNGLVINGENKQKLITAVAKLSNYQGLAQRLGDQGRQRVRQQFNWANQAQKIYQIINN